MSEADETLTIDIVSDVVCPWCYLGEKRLEAALAGDRRHDRAAIRGQRRSRASTGRTSNWRWT